MEDHTLNPGFTDFRRVPMDNPSQPPLYRIRPEALGCSAYEASFGIRFMQESEVDRDRSYDFKTRVVPSSFPLGFPVGLEGARVAVVGNGEVDGHGAEIDAHDEVIRISQMAKWLNSPADAGERITMWSGQLAFVASDGIVDEKFRRVVEEGVRLWALSPFHVTCDAFNFLRSRQVPPEVTILPSASCLFDLYGRYMGAEDIELLFSIAPVNRHLRSLVRHELLFTGTRLVLALEAAGVRSVSLYGFDLFTRAQRSPWFGHEPGIDLRVLLGVQRRFADAGREFRWCPRPPDLQPK